MVTMKRLSTVLLPILVLGLFIVNPSYAESNTKGFACSVSTNAPKELGTLTIAVVTEGPLLEWGTQENCFKKYGLTIKPVLVSSRTVAVSGLVGRSYDLITANPATLVQLMTNGDFPVKIIAPSYGYSAEELTSAIKNPTYNGELTLETGLIVKKNSKIKSFKDLEHKKVGVAGLQSSAHGGLLMAIKANHGDPSTTEFVVLPRAQFSAALQRGDVDAIAISEPFASQAISDGGRLVGYPGAYFYKPDTPALVYASLDSITERRKVEMRAFQKAILEINHLLNQPENEDSYRAVYGKILGVDGPVLAKIHFPVLIEKKVGLASLRYLPYQLFQIGFTRTKVDISSLTFI